MMLDDSSMVETDIFKMPPDEMMAKGLQLMTGKEAIHSGHFMVSDIDEVVEVCSPSHVVHESDCEQDVPSEEIEQVFETSMKETSKTYTFGTQSVSIDASLTKLFECMSLAYSGKLTSPRWKTFKGLKLRLKEKIRMNNIIWRAWHIQFVARRKPPVCQFATPLDGETHGKAESVVLEGKYWKRRLAAVAAEYKKWRMFSKDRFACPQSDDADFMDMDYKFPSWSVGPLSEVDDDFYMDFTDTLFSTLLPHQSFDFPNTREIARAGIADFIQPGLVQLQPTVDDFMDTFEPLHDFLLSRLPPLPEEGPVHDSSTSGNPFASTLTHHPSAARESSQQFHDSRQLSSSATAAGEAYVPSALPDACAAESLAREMDLKSSIDALGQSIDPAAIFGFRPASRLQKNRTNFASSSPPPPLPSATSNIRPETLPSRVPSKSPVLQPNPQVNNPLLGVMPGVRRLPSQEKMNLTAISHRQSRAASGVDKHGVVPITKGVTGAKSKQQTAVSSSSSSTAKTDGYRRHSHTGVGTRKASTQENDADVQFVVPKAHAKPRVRSRSVSTPQNATQKVTPTPSPSLSMTNVSISPPPGSMLGTGTTAVPHGAVLAQLLASGATFSHTSLNSTTTAVNTSPTVTIISSVPNPPVSSALHTLVLSPLTLTAVGSVSGVNELPRGLILGTTNGCTPVVSKASPASPCNSAASSPGRLTETSTPPPAPTHKPFRPKSCEERIQYKEHRRVCHINAEQKRRCNIKNGFQSLHHLLPSLCHNPNAKVSKAAMLQKTADYIRTLKIERQMQQEEAEQLKKQIEGLNKAISVYQSQLPSTGAPVPCQRSNYMKDMFEDYVRRRTLVSWKFWIFSLLMEPLLESFASCVTTSSIEEMCKSVLGWLDKHCSLVELRPVVLNSLRHLSTSTNILSNPAGLSDEATRAVTKKEVVLP